MNIHSSFIFFFRLIFAVCITGAEMSMAIMAFADSGTIMQFTAVIAGAGTQVLPSLIKNRLFWVVWVGFFAVTVFGQLTYLTKTSSESNEFRAKNSLAATDTQNQITTLTKEKDAMKCRDKTEIMADQKIATTKKERDELQKEYTQANRKAKISEKIEHLLDDLKIIHAEQNVDQVTALISKVSGYSAALIFLLYRLVLSLVITLSGPFIWNAVFQDKEFENILRRLKIAKPQHAPVIDNKAAEVGPVVASTSVHEINEQPAVVVRKSKQLDDTEKWQILKNALENDPTFMLSMPKISKLVGVGTDRARRLKIKLEPIEKADEKS